MKDLLESSQDTTARLNRQVKPFVTGMEKKRAEREAARIRAALGESLPEAPPEKPTEISATAPENLPVEESSVVKPAYRDTAWSDEEEKTTRIEVPEEMPRAAPVAEVAQPEVVPSSPVAPEVPPAQSEAAPEVAPELKHQIKRDFVFPTDADGLKALSNRERDRFDRLNERFEANREQLNPLELEALTLAMEFSGKTADKADRLLKAMGLEKQPQPEAAAPGEVSKDEEGARDRAAEQKRMLFEEYAIKPGFAATLDTGIRIRVTKIEGGTIFLDLNDGADAIPVPPEEYKALLDHLPAPYVTRENEQTAARAEAQDTTTASPEVAPPVAEAEKPKLELSPALQKIDAHKQELIAAYASGKNIKEKLAKLAERLGDLEKEGRLEEGQAIAIDEALGAVVSGEEKIESLNGMIIALDGEEESAVDLRDIATDLIVNRITHLRGLQPKKKKG